jgi:hypothetical protein
MRISDTEVIWGGKGISIGSTGRVTRTTRPMWAGEEPMQTGTRIYSEEGRQYNGGEGVIGRENVQQMG